MSRENDRNIKGHKGGQKEREIDRKRKREKER
jgi:hypothetical protein